MLHIGRPGIAFEQRSSTYRYLFLLFRFASEIFQHSHPALMTSFLARLAEARRSRWTVVPEREDFLDRVRQNARKTIFLGFVTKRELGDDALQVAKLLTAETMVPFLASLVRLSSSTGMCSM